ncbi:CocE/NonD family hydrolase [Microbacterium sp. A93]|uniref:CocE/NonD family hydrolase n=1 Tax=Microbacterium sp. A93 TaxID=3450716 RepID=UPI003F430547
MGQAGEQEAFAFGRHRFALRDGVELDALVFRRIDDAAPTLVLRTPYGVDNLNAMPSPDYLSLLREGYNIAWVGCRGTFGSDGDFAGIALEQEDGWDTIEWIVSHPWSDGRVGTFGGSYTGYTQWAVAASGHPAVRAMAIRVSSTDWYRAPWYHEGGVLNHEMATKWHLTMRAAEHQRAHERDPAAGPTPAAVQAQVSRLLDLPESVALRDHPLVASDSRLLTVIDHPQRDDHWRTLDCSNAFGRMTQPVLMIAGWFDHFLTGQLADFRRYRALAGSPEARRGTRLIIGPWTHGPFENNFPAVDFGSHAGSAGADLTGEHVRHFRQSLPIGASISGPEQPVKIFVMGINQWREEQDWPLPDAVDSPWHLSLDGSLSHEQSRGEGELAFDYDPGRPVPTLGGNSTGSYRWDGPVDQRPLLDRDDVLVFSSAPLEVPVEVTGHVRATLFVSSSAVDTDITVKLTDIHPDGRVLSVCDGILRLRHRHGVEASTLLAPGEVYEVTVDMSATSLVFLAGHRIGLMISSSDYPRYQRNTNTGGVIAAEPIAASVRARNSIHIGPSKRSRVILPIVPPRS